MMIESEENGERLNVNGVFLSIYVSWGLSAPKLSLHISRSKDNGKIWKLVHSFQFKCLEA